MVFRRRFSRSRRWRPRRRRATRPTTEQGTGRWERSFFNFAVEQAVGSDPDSASADVVQIVSGISLTTPLSILGSQAEGVAKVLQQPIKGFDVLAITWDLDCFIAPDFVSDTAQNAQAYVLQTGHALFSQRLSTAGVPASFPPYWRSQWPVYQASPVGIINQDDDYALRTHFHRMQTVYPNRIESAPPELPSQSLSPGWPRYRYPRTTKLRRRFTDTQGLFFEFWNYTPPTWLPGPTFSVNWTVTGSLWYRMVW